VVGGEKEYREGFLEVGASAVSSILPLNARAAVFR
jgi:hypothetical protein